MNDAKPKPAVRVNTADRRQQQLVTEDLDSRLGADHTARSVWAFVEAMDLSRFYEGIASVEGVPGRAATDPKVLLALWLYAATDGVGSAREIEQLTKTDDAYRWLRGGVPLNYHLLSDFRTGHQKALDELLTQSIAALLKAKVVTLKRVAQDGTKVRASAGSGSFRREGSLQRCLIAAQEQLEWVRRDAEKPDAGKRVRALAAQKRAAEEKMERVQRALVVLPAIRAKQEDKKRETRVSTTDPDARIMRTGDNGYRPAYNVQYSTDVDGMAVVGVAVTDSPADAHQLPPMLEQIEERTGQLPEQCFVDEGYSNAQSIEAADEKNVLMYSPVPQQIHKCKDGTFHDPSLPRAEQSEAVVHHRLRMATPEGKQAYKIRGQVAELTNADVKGRQRLTQVLVRGLPKVTCVVLMSALALNLTRMLAAGLLG